MVAMLAAVLIAWLFFAACVGPLFWIESGGGRGLRVNASSALKTGGCLVLTQPSEPGHATDRPAHSKAYERWMIIPFVLVPLGFVFALFYWASFYD